MTDTRNSTRKLALGGIVTALSFLVLYAACVLPTGRVGFYFIAAFLPVVLLCEGWRGTAALSSLAVSLLAFFILPDRMAVLPYVCFLAWYALVRELLSRFSVLISRLVVLIACDLGIALWFFAVLVLAGVTPIELYSIAWPTWVWAVAIAALQIAVIVADWFFGLCVRYYCRVLQPRIKSQRQ